MAADAAGRWTRKLVGLLCLLAMIACNKSSPTAPDPPAMPQANIVFADPQALTEHRAVITSLLDQAFVQANQVIPVAGVRFTVYADASRAIPGWGLGGYAPAATDIEIVIDPGHPGLGQILPQRLPAIAAHELHHAARWRGPGYGMTLLETMVSEGLADHFAVELIGGPLPPWTEAFPDSQNDQFLNRARPLLDSTSFDFGAWFFGAGMDLPRWTGYTLGYRLVRTYQDRNPSQSAAQLVHASAELFRPD